MSNYSIKPIETSYKGYRFRSRTEARYAIFFDELGFKWGYEIEGFELPSGAQYLPDFYLYDFNVWFEVKGSIETISDEETDKIVEFVCESGKNLILAIGQPGQEEMYFVHGEKFKGNLCIYYQSLNFRKEFNGKKIESMIFIHKSFRVWFSPSMFDSKYQISCFHHLGDGVYPRLDHAYQQARSARFEFGERK